MQYEIGFFVKTECLVKTVKKQCYEYCFRTYFNLFIGMRYFNTGQFRVPKLLKIYIYILLLLLLLCKIINLIYSFLLKEVGLLFLKKNIYLFFIF